MLRVPPFSLSALLFLREFSLHWCPCVLCCGRFCRAQGLMDVSQSDLGKHPTLFVSKAEPHKCRVLVRPKHID